MGGYGVPNNYSTTSIRRLPPESHLPRWRFARTVVRISCECIDTLGGLIQRDLRGMSVEQMQTERLRACYTKQAPGSLQHCDAGQAGLYESVTISNDPYSTTPSPHHPLQRITVIDHRGWKHPCISVQKMPYEVCGANTGHHPRERRGGFCFVGEW